MEYFEENGFKNGATKASRWQFDTLTSLVSCKNTTGLCELSKTFDPVHRRKQ